MALLPLFFEVVNKRLLVSAASSDIFNLPPFFQEDGLDIRFTALQPTGQLFSGAYNKIVLTGYSLAISVVHTYGTVDANTTTFTSSDNETVLSGQINLNTAALNALTDSYPVYLEIRMTPPSGLPWRAIFATVFRKSYFIGATLVPAIGDTALGAIEAQRLFMPLRMAPGQGIIFRSPDDTQWVFKSLYNDGTMHEDPMTPDP